MKVLKKEAEEPQEGGRDKSWDCRKDQGMAFNGRRQGEVRRNQASFQKGLEMLAQRYITNSEIMRYLDKDLEWLFRILNMGLRQNQCW